MARNTSPREAQLAIVDEQTYYRAGDGKHPTSGQYYLNRKGLTAEQACRWGAASYPSGNWAPAVVGLAWSADPNRGYLSLLNNAPVQKDTLLEYKVTVDGVDTPCAYSGDQITSPSFSLSVRSAMAVGCTVSVGTGATFTLILEPNK